MPFKMNYTYADGSSVAPFELDLESVFKPSMNDWWKYGQRDGLDELSAPTWTEYRKLLGSIYQRENVRAYPGLFFPMLSRQILGNFGKDRSIYERWAEQGSAEAVRFLAIVDKMLEHTPDDKLWVLYFMQVNSVQEGNRLYLQVPELDRSETRTFPQGDSLDDLEALNICSISWGTDNKLMEYSYQGGNFAAEWGALRDRLCTWITTFDENCLVDIDSLWPTLSDFVGLIHMFIFDHATTYHTFQGQSRNAIRNVKPSSIAERPEYTIELDATYSHCKVVLRIPVMVGDRSTLSQMLAHSANTREYLPERIVAKVLRHDPKTGKKEWREEINPRLYGIELEVSTDYDPSQIIAAMETPFAMCKSDSSISGSKRNAIEIVSAPMSKRAHRRRWAKFFDNLLYQNFDCSSETNNGLHIHVSLEEFGFDKEKYWDANSNQVHIDRLKRIAPTSAHLRKMLWFLADNANRQFWLWVCERTASQWDRWCATPNFQSTNRVREYNNIVKTWLANDQFHRVPGSFVGLRGAANFSRHGTIEFRMFKGFVSYASVMKGIDTVDALIEYTRDVNFQSMSVRHFMRWLKDTPKQKFVFLKLWFEKADPMGKRFNEIANAHDVEQIIFGERNADAIVDLFNSKKVVPTKRQLGYLNSLFAKKMFETVKVGETKDKFNKTVPMMELYALVSSKTPVARFDKALQSKYGRAGTKREIPPVAPAGGQAASPNPFRNIRAATRSFYEGN